MNALLAFFSLTYLVSWSLFAAGAAALGRPVAPASGFAPIAGSLFLLGTIAPALVALALTARADGRVGATALIAQIGRGPVKARWYLFAATYIATIKIAAALLHRFVAGAWPLFGETPVYIMVAATIISTPVQAGEEIGWRGYALPRLAEQIGRAPASVVLGVIWALWHLPLFFIPVSDTFGQSFPLFLLQVTALAVAMAWLYWRTGGSLLPVMLLHAAVNNTKDIVPSIVEGATNPFVLSTSLVAWLTVALLWVCAAYFLVQMSRQRKMTPRTDCG